MAVVQELGLHPICGSMTAAPGMGPGRPISSHGHVNHRGVNAMGKLPFRRRNRWAWLALVLCIVAVTTVSAGSIYRWVDDRGRIHFTDKPPSNVGAEEMEVKVITYAAPPVVSTTNGSVSKQVIIYSTEWCGVCKKAKAYFRSKDIPFKEYDVEKSTKGRRDYKKLKGKGVPLILVGNQRMSGFSPGRFETMLKTAKGAGH